MASCWVEAAGCCCTGGSGALIGGGGGGGGAAAATGSARGGACCCGGGGGGIAKDGAKFAAPGEKLNVGALGLKLKPDRGGGGGGGGTGAADCSSSQLSAMVIWGMRSANNPGPGQSRSAAGLVPVPYLERS